MVDDSGFIFGQDSLYEIDERSSTVYDCNTKETILINQFDNGSVYNFSTGKMTYNGENVVDTFQKYLNYFSYLI